VDIVGSKPTSPAILVQTSTERLIIYVTNESTKQFNHIDNKIEDIKDLIVNYIEKDLGD
jgi:hypothetical protein